MDWWTAADHAAARAFGERHYRLLVALRVVRRSWSVVLALAVAGGAASAAAVWDRAWTKTALIALGGAAMTAVGWRVWRWWTRYRWYRW